MAVARIAAGLPESICIWATSTPNVTGGMRKEYVEAMWLMLQQDEPDDYVVATGIPATVRDFCEIAFARAGLDYEKHVRLDPRYLRPSEVDALVGDGSRATAKLGWTPRTTWRELAELMVDADIALLDDQLSGRAIQGTRAH